MNNSRETAKYWFRVICNLIITVCMTAAFSFFWFDQLNGYMYVEFLNKGNWMMVGVYMILSILMMVTFHGYEIGNNRMSTSILSQVLACFITNCLEIVITVLMVGQVEFIGEIILAYALLTLLQLLLAIILTVVLTKISRAAFPPYQVLMVTGEYTNSLAHKVAGRPDKYQIVETISCEEPLDSIAEKLASYDAILLNDIPTSTRNEILKVCFDQKKRVYFTPKISDIFVKGSEEMNIFDTPLYLCRNSSMSLPQRFIKRAGDIIISLIGIIITSPIMLVTAILIKKYDGGPVFYRQTRCTIDGREFKLMKFRSMITDAEKDGKARLATENDDRITPIGKFIRATRIDELPQFFNILRGEMSLVGPRPERPEINKEYYEEIPEFAYRLRVKAGLTGYAQVYGKYNTTSYDKLKLDLIYVQKASVLLDLQLILLTLRVVFTKDATEGLEEGQTNASTKN